MAERERTESDLRRAVLVGDRRAWRSLYDAAFDGLFAYVQWRCGGMRDWAEDIVQETWLVAVRRIADFQPERASFLTWLRGIAAHVLRNHFRAERRFPENLESIQDLTSAIVRSDDMAERIAYALAGIPENYEAVLRAKYLQRQTMDEIAKEGRISVKAVESLLSRARAAFRQRYEMSEAIEERIQP